MKLLGFLGYSCDTGRKTSMEFVGKYTKIQATWLRRRSLSAKAARRCSDSSRRNASGDNLCLAWAFGKKKEGFGSFFDVL